MTLLTLLAEAAIRSLALGAAVWIGLKALRVRNPQAQITAWTLVLAAAVAMPLLMRWPTVTIPAPLPRVLPAASPVAFLMGPVQAARPRTSINWPGVVGSCYLAGVILLLLRMTAGLVLTRRLHRTANPVPADWDIGGDVRHSEAIAAPATFGSTILLPSECMGWTLAMRRAVLAHERSHVEHADFYIQLVASVYRSFFWFSPLAWWLRKQLAELAETRSDDAAIANFPDRPSYAEILIGFAKKVQKMPLVVAMARPATVARRVDRILAGTPLSQALNWHIKTLLTASLIPLIALAAGCTIHARAQTAAPSARAVPPPTVPQQSFGSDSDRFAIVTGSSVMGVSQSQSDGLRAQALRDRLQEDYIWFARDFNFYYVADAATVAAAKEMLVAQQELGRAQAELGKQQEALGMQQAQASVKAPDLSRELDSLRMQLDLVRDQLQHAAGKELRQEEFGDLQARLGDLQAHFGDIQAQVGDRQSRIGAAQAALGQKQAELGERQAQLGEQQERLAEQVSWRMRSLLDQAMKQGLAKPVE